MEQRAPTAGVIVMDKQEGVTSAGLCRLVKGRLRAGGAPKSIKVGHGGTLDPMATGVVVILVGKATKMCDVVMAGEKRYLAGVDLSAVTPSDDRETERTLVEVADHPSVDQVRAAAARFVGEIDQTPSAFSALWIDGKRAYEMARKGQEVAMVSRRVVVHACTVLEYAWPMVTLDIRCGKGVYIRSIARDLGVALGTGGTLMWLRRTAVDHGRSRRRCRAGPCQGPSTRGTRPGRWCDRSRSRRALNRMVTGTTSRRSESGVGPGDHAGSFSGSQSSWVSCPSHTRRAVRYSVVPAAKK
jgi:tRNA pseudouridine55 synthase